MSDTPAFDFSKFVPGFDFLQNLGKGASTAAPAMGGWVAPTLSVEELDKRITELKAVQFWLDQNAVALKATIQALEVQKMTLATLKGMNLSMTELASAFKLKPETASAPKAAEKPAEKPAEKAEEPAAADAPAAPGIVDPLKWWGSLTEQFQQIAGAALKDANTQAALEKSKNLATNFAAEAIKSVGEIAKAAGKTVVPPAAPKAAAAAKAAAAKKTPAKKAPAKKAAAKKHPD
nr:PhaM family polyhydroxyalkanoate granule multifunctional regulatory protein [uncultured Albidiferax sp.]